MHYIVRYFFIVFILSQYQHIETSLSDKKLEQEKMAGLWFSAIHEGNIAQIKNLITRVDVNIKDKYGWPALMYAAAKKDNINIAHILLQTPDININIQDNNGWTPLIRAACYGFEDTVRILIADPAININMSNKIGDTALIWAAAAGYTDIVKLLLTMPNVQLNIKNKERKNALAIALAKTDTGIIDLIIQKIEQMALANKSKLFDAIKNNDIDTIKSLTIQIDASIFNMIDAHGNTPLHYAFNCNNMPIAVFVLQQVEDPQELINRLNNSGQFPLEIINPTSPLFKLCMELAYTPKTIASLFYDFMEHAAKFLTEDRTIKHYRKMQWDRSQPLQSLPSCANCSKINCTLRCSACGIIYYCSTKCQKIDWDKHKSLCRKHT